MHSGSRNQAKGCDHREESSRGRGSLGRLIIRVGGVPAQHCCASGHLQALPLLRDIRKLGNLLMRSSSSGRVFQTRNTRTCKASGSAVPWVAPAVAQGIFEEGVIAVRVHAVARSWTVVAIARRAPCRCKALFHACRLFSVFACTHLCKAASSFSILRAFHAVSGCCWCCSHIVSKCILGLAASIGRF